MDTTDFAVLVGRLERESDRRPRAYVLKLMMVVALGYVLPALAILAVVAAIATIVWTLLNGSTPGFWHVVALGISVSVTVLSIRGLLIPVAEPDGRELTSDEAPALFAAIDEVVQKLASSPKGVAQHLRIDSVALDREFALSLHLIPQFGVFGQYAHRLQIGLPLLNALSIAEIKTLLAHEIAHLGGMHNRFSSWIYRQRTAWSAIEERYAEPESLIDRALAYAYGRYASFFLAYSLVMARNHELAADRAAARATHARLFGRALIKTELIGRFLAEVFWTKLFEQVEKLPEPQYLPYSVMSRAITLAQKQWQRADWLHEGMRRYSAEHDTHPALGERLAALEVTPELPTNVADSSALALLGENAAHIVKEFDEQWRAEYVPAWRKRHDAIREARWKISQYEVVAEADLKPEALWEKASLLLDIAREREALDSLRVLVAREPTMAKAQFLLGRLLLESADERGLHHLASAVQHDPELIDAVGELGYGYLVQRGRRAEAQRFWDRIQAL
ncbi:MAG: M48 family metalloprotease [Povalibacter sp.]